MMENPAYKGEWIHPMNQNPDFVDDDTLYAYKSFAYVGIEDWQVKAGTFFDDILITDSIETAEEWASRFELVRAGEKEAFHKEEEVKKAEAQQTEDSTETDEDGKDEL